MSDTDGGFWQRKLAGYLHDPPSKALDIAGHWEVARSAFVQAGFSDEEISRYEKAADHTAAAADRLPFPHHAASGMRCHFDGQRNAFRHPLCGERLAFAPFASAELGIEGQHSVQPVVSVDGGGDADWRARHFAHWRLWRKHASENDFRLGYLPADTRIPDHTIWHHMAVVSALAGCVEVADGQTSLRPAFLKFQLGPVQDFIAAARSVRDLWSGSYLLSWLMASGLKVLSAEVGPDAVIFPSLHGQPLFDLHWRDELWKKVTVSDGQGRSVWESLGHDGRDGHRDRLLVPSLPNVFLAVVPAARADELGRLVERAVRDEWERIADAVWNYCDAAVPTDGTNLTADEGAMTREWRKKAFDRQRDRFLQVAWAAEPWPESLDAALSLAASNLPAGMPAHRAAESVRAVTEMATRQMPEDHRDGRYFTDRERKTTLSNVGAAWSVLVQHVGWKLDAVRQTRAFEAWAEDGATKVGTEFNKDALNGREEAVAGGREWRDRCAALGAPWSRLFKDDAWVGASTLIKRVWHLAYLKEPWGLRTGHGDEFPMPNTHGVAAGRPYDDNERDVDELPDDEKHFAVLALDGDEIGKWVSGERMPAFGDVLADYSDGSGNRDQGSAPYFRRPEFGDFLERSRPLSPGFHLQFSETLANFALLCAGRIVAHFHGRLIYAGGDDVLALLPGGRAIECAEALRAAFRGCAPGVAGIGSPAPGFLTFDDLADSDGKPIPLPVPGPRADCSAGIAIAHFKSPLQDVVRAAQEAEKRAKRDVASGGLGRSAVAVSLFKRSGEITEWGAKWDSGGLALLGKLLAMLETRELSTRFPHRVCELLSLYSSGGRFATKDAVSLDEAWELAGREWEFAIQRQSKKGRATSNRATLPPLLATYLDHLVAEPGATPTRIFEALKGLCTTVAFAARTSGRDAETTNQPTGERS